VFSSPTELARFLWGTAEASGADNPAYPALMQAKQAWAQQDTPGGKERLVEALKALDQFVRQEYFYPPHDPVTVPGTPRQVVTLGYQASDVLGAGVYWSLTSTDVMGDRDTVNHLRMQIDRMYGPGFFNKHIVSVRRVSDEEMMVKQVVFGESCDSSKEVV